MSIQRGDQYTIPFKINIDGTVVTPDDCSDVKIKIGKYLKSYSDNELTYSTTNKTWGFPITQAMTKELSTTATMYQVGVKFEGSDIVYSSVMPIDVNASIISEVW